MSPSYCTWRPLTSADSKQLTSVVRDVLVRWQCEWFAQQHDITIAVEQLPPGSSFLLSNERWHRALSGQVHALLRLSDWNRYAETAMKLSEHAASTPTSPLQQHIHDCIRDEMLEELMQMLQSGLTASSHLERADASISDVMRFKYGALKLTVSTEDHPSLLEIHCSAEHLWGCTKLAPSTAVFTPLLVSRSSALAATSVSISAHLKAPTVSAMELSTLAVGDVLTTSQSIAEPVEVRLCSREGASSLLGWGHPVRSGEKRALAFNFTNNQKAS